MHRQKGHAGIGWKKARQGATPYTRRKSSYFEFLAAIASTAGLAGWSSSVCMSLKSIWVKGRYEIRELQETFVVPLLDKPGLQLYKEHFEISSDMKTKSKTANNPYIRAIERGNWFDALRAEGAWYWIESARSVQWGRCVVRFLGRVWSNQTAERIASILCAISSD